MNRVGKILLGNTSLFLCDMQEKFSGMISHFNAIVSVSNRMLKAAKLLEIPVLITEQYPKGLGKTVPELGDISGIPVFEKQKFSMVLPNIEEYLRTAKKFNEINQVLLCGIEAHVCVLNTALDLIEKGYQVHVIVDACSSRNPVDRMYAFQHMKQSGAFLTTSESAILSLVCGSDHPKFKDAQKLIWDLPPDSGLLKNGQNN